MIIDETPALYILSTGEKIRELRKSLGLTQEEFADILCVQKLCIVRWETGIRNCPTPTMKLINILTKYNLWKSE